MSCDGDLVGGTMTAEAPLVKSLETQAPGPLVGGEAELEIEALALGGKGLGRLSGLVVFVERALPGQRVRVRIERRKKRHSEARLLEVLRPAPEQVEPPCPHFGECGGCSWQHLDYAAQLTWKRRFVTDALQRLAGARELPVEPTLPSPFCFGHRNKLDFAFAGAGAQLALGLRKSASHAVLNLETCLLPPPGVLEVLRAAREFCRESGVASYEPLTGKGFWRFLSVRALPAESGRMVLQAQCITTPTPARAPLVRELGASLLERVPDLCGVVHGVRRNPEQVALAEDTVQVLGEEAMQVLLAGLRYRVTAGAFFQTNTAAAERLFLLVRELAAVQPGETVWDLYCGGGGAGLLLAREAGLLVGFDSSREAVADAVANAAANELGNCVFRSGDVARLLPRERSKPDLVLLDPPRGGLDGQVLGQLLALAPQRLVYVSCNPATLARDLGQLLESYELLTVRPLDLFPQSHHVECVVLLTRR